MPAIWKSSCRSDRIPFCIFGSFALTLKGVLILGCQSQSCIVCKLHGHCRCQSANFQAYCHRNKCKSSFDNIPCKWPVQSALINTALSTKRVRPKNTHTHNESCQAFKNRFMWKTLSRRLLQAKTSACCSLPRTFRIYLIHHSSWKRSACQGILIYFAKCLHNVHLALRCSVRI